MNTVWKSLAATTLLASLLPLTAMATSPSTCTVKSRSASLALMHCPSGLAEQAWIDAAKAVCPPGQACNVWIWEDASKVPATAPKTDAELPKAATSAAVAVWINDSASLLKIKKAR